MSDLLRTSIELSIILLLEIAAVFLLGMLLIPVLRAKKTGRYDRKLGSRFKTDGTEPSMGGLVAAGAFAVCFFPLALRTSLSASTNYQDTHAGLVGAGVFAVLVMLIGLTEDRLKHFLARPAGVRPVFRQALIFALCLSLTLWITLHSRKSTEVLLPFRLGYIEFGVLYYPLTALAMTFIINIFKAHFCFGDDLSNSVGGLVEATSALSLLAVSFCAQSADLKAAGLLASCGSACCIGMLIWTFSPSKLISGASGSMFAGALFAASVLLSKSELLFFIAALPQLADSTAALIHFIRYKRRRIRTADDTPKQPLRVYFRKKGAGEHTVVLMFLVLGVISAVLSLIFAVYHRSLALSR